MTTLYNLPEETHKFLEDTNLYKKSEYEYEFDIPDVNVFNEIKKEIKVWDKNRFLHKDRIPELVKNYKDNLNRLPITLIHLSLISNEYQIWDGQHRWYAIKKLIRDKDLDNKFKNSLLNKFIFILNVKESEIDMKHKFISINEGKSVSKIYTLEQKKDIQVKTIKNILEYLSDKLRETYPKLIKNINNFCYPPHFDLNDLIDDLGVYLIDKNLDKYSKEELWEKIMEYNILIKDYKFKQNKYHKNVNQDHIDKATVNKCWLFLDKDYSIFQLLDSLDFT